MLTELLATSGGCWVKAVARWVIDMCRNATAATWLQPKESQVLFQCSIIYVFANNFTKSLPATSFQLVRECTFLLATDCCQAIIKQSPGLCDSGYWTEGRYQDEINKDYFKLIIMQNYFDRLVIGELHCSYRLISF